MHHKLPRSSQRIHLIRQRGLGLVSAIFIITIGAMLAVAMSQFMQLGQLSTIRVFQSTRAMQAAESGVQLELNRLTHPQNLGGCATNASSSATYNFGSTPGIAGCNAAVSCTVTTIDSVDYVTFTSVGRCGDSGDVFGQASRRIELRAMRP
ncbi:MAG: hypothetical protein ACPGPF_00960 [Pontibacterium sp.]